VRHPKTAFGVVLALLAACVVFPGCGKHEDPWESVPGGPPRVLVSFTPLYCFTKAVAGDDVKVLSLLTTIGPHDHKPTADDALAARKADLFLVNGLDLDDFVTRVANNSGNPNKDLIKKVGDAIPEDKLIHTEEEDPKEKEKGKKHDHEHGEHDPHVWLGPDTAILMVKEICKLLQEKDPSRKKTYQDNADAYVKKIQQLHADGLKALKNVKNKKFVTNHESFRYFARAFGLTVLDSIQTQPGVTADAGQMAKLIKLCEDEKVRVIAVEPQYSRAGAEALRDNLKGKKLDVEIIELDPIETAADRASLTPNYYLEKMKANIDTLVKHLK
jgi:zinc transport system substrate-binding protein